MSGEVQQILNLYEKLNLSLEDIAEDRDISLTEVKAVLMQYSSIYRGAIKEDKTLDFTDSELELANKAIAEIMLSTDDENIKFRAAKYIRQDKKGRLDAAKNMRGLNINVFTFNDQMKRAQMSLERTRAVASGHKEAPIIEVKQEQED